MEEEFKDQNIQNRDIVDEMEESYLSYAMSVIISRALPDVRDGLKPVHRRVLYGAAGIGAQWNRKHKKSARIVGEVMGRFHPHGDQAIYDTLVRLAQDFSVRWPLINGQGNFGNIDGDNAAAMRYTESKLTEISELLLNGIDEECVDFRLTYDEVDKEPIVLPSNFPNLLANGSSGIAVGMATSIPPFSAIFTWLSSFCARFPSMRHPCSRLPTTPASSIPTALLARGLDRRHYLTQSAKGRCGP